MVSALCCAKPKGKNLEQLVLGKESLGLSCDMALNLTQHLAGPSFQRKYELLPPPDLLSKSQGASTATGLEDDKLLKSTACSWGKRVCIRISNYAFVYTDL